MGKNGIKLYLSWVKRVKRELTFLSKKTINTSHKTSHNNLADLLEEALLSSPVILFSGKWKCVLFSFTHYHKTIELKRKRLKLKFSAMLLFREGNISI